MLMVEKSDAGNAPGHPALFSSYHVRPRPQVTFRNYLSNGRKKAQESQKT
jgi:hypothetical protein